MTLPEASKLMAYLAAMYRERVPDETVAGWADALRTVPFERAMVAARKHVATSAFFPKVAEIIKPIAEVEVGLDDGEQQWLEVRRAISRWGRYRGWEFSNPITARVVEAIGKDDLCNSENLAVERAHFMRIYGSYHRSELEAAKHAPLMGREYTPRIGGVARPAQLSPVGGEDPGGVE